jgi:hypothetical protein
MTKMIAGAIDVPGKLDAGRFPEARRTGKWLLPVTPISPMHSPTYSSNTISPPLAWARQIWCVWFGPWVSFALVPSLKQQHA